jgi:hypothetical protein
LSKLETKPETRLSVTLWLLSMWAGVWQLKSMLKVAACRIMLTTSVSAENKNQSECEALMQFRLKVTLANAAKAQPTAAQKAEAPAEKKSPGSAK